MMLPITLLLFARPYNVPFVSDTLADASFHLEHPRKLSNIQSLVALLQILSPQKLASYNPAHHSNIRYSNPHNPAGGDKRRTQISAGLAGGSGLSAGIQVSKAIDIQRQQVDDVFQNLKSGVDLDEADAPSMITTKLYPHQKQALSFLLDRERTVDSASVSVDESTPAEELNGLWRARRDYKNRIIGWTNAVVTDFRIDGANAPPQTRGAILADDMGLGQFHSWWSLKVRGGGPTNVELISDYR